VNALKELGYKRDINLGDGRILTNAWCKKITEQEDGTFIATYAFERIKVTCKSCHSILRFSQGDI
jgi:hypothetical protein